MAKKRVDECLFCSKRSCSTRIVRLIEPKYDEIACHTHVEDLEKHSDEVLGSKNGVMRNHISSSARLKRGEIMSCMVKK
jgi:hypothetical protein